MDDKKLHGIRKINKNTYNKYKEDYSSKKSKKNSSNLSKLEARKLVFLVFLLILIIVTIVLIIFNIFFNPKKQIEEPTYLGTTRSTQVVERVRDSEEYERFKIYLGQIIKKIKEKDYNYVYDRMNRKYKEQYFPTIGEFIEYCENILPENITVTHTNFERISDYYVVVTDLVNPRNHNDIRNREGVYFVFREYGFDDYEFSFAKKSKSNVIDEVEDILNQ